MFSYYGAKTNIVDHYPRPQFDHIIEPFAGSARYALKYWDRQVTLVDSYEVVCSIWKYLQQASPHDILSLPIPPAGKTTDDFTYDCDSAKWFVGFLIGFGQSRPVKKQSKNWSINLSWPRIDNNLRRIASNLDKIRHWNIIHGDYRYIENQASTWFIDPPYQVGGHKYKHNRIDYAELGVWCNERRGQVIVCENSQASWLPFEPLCRHRGSAKMQQEVIWTNTPLEKQLHMQL